MLDPKYRNNGESKSKRSGNAKIKYGWPWVLKNQKYPKYYPVVLLFNGDRDEMGHFFRCNLPDYFMQTGKSKWKDITENWTQLCQKITLSVYRQQIRARPQDNFSLSLLRLMEVCVSCFGMGTRDTKAPPNQGSRVCMPHVKGFGKNKHVLGPRERATLLGNLSSINPSAASAGGMPVSIMAERTGILLIGSPKRQSFG